MYFFGCNCERIRINCIIEIAAITTAAHLACIAPELTGFPGVVCHGAAYAKQITASITWSVNADNCNSNHIN